jgi:hypothetical protein
LSLGESLIVAIGWYVDLLLVAGGGVSREPFPETSDSGFVPRVADALIVETGGGKFGIPDLLKLLQDTPTDRISGD